jgi:putative pyruvate formate lyase activating enzyme
METAASLGWEERLERVKALASPCRLCEVRCEVDRLGGERGRCGLSDTTHVYSKMLHFGEEQHLVPSYVVSFSGCSMHCTFCSEDEHLRPPFRAAPTEPGALAAYLIRDIKRQRVRVKNINLVGGEPSVSLPFIVELARALAEEWPERPPLLLNTNGYMTAEALALCEGMIDIFLFDLKFGPGACGWEVGKVKDYFEVVTARLTQAARFKSARLEGEGLVVRHLLMPGHQACCTEPALRWIAQALPRATVNVMPAFTVFSGTRAARHWQESEVSAREQAQALAFARSLPLGRLMWDGAPVPDVLSLGGDARIDK